MTQDTLAAGVSKAFQAVDEETRNRLAPEDLALLFRLEKGFAFTFQQLRLFARWSLDCASWGEMDFRKTALGGIDAAVPGSGNPRQQGEAVFAALQTSYDFLAAKAKVYPSQSPKETLPSHRFVEKDLKGRIFRLCPAASEKAVCCNLKVLNIVDNCAMACSYCVLQNHYDEATIAVPVNLKAKLAEIELNPEKRYRIGTGEYSDSLLWGNKNDILADLCDFARANPNAIIELKTKSANVGWILENDIPPNVCCTWSLNPQIIIANEEHKTASLDRRLEAARAVADKGVKVGFHFHPMFYFEGWEAEYQALIARVIATFRPEEVLWVSLGCITLLKGFAQDFRLKFRHSKLLQMETETTPDGKITYAFAVREKLYRNALQALEPWKDQVFQYMCMEHKPMWDTVMGFAYPNMAVFDDVFNASAFAKLRSYA
ncbi:MAG: DNA photolyase [Fibrobacterota bacterium]|nr:DNA photolyase [Fibrobacterota bacterium]